MSHPPALRLDKRKIPQKSSSPGPHAGTAAQGPPKGGDSPVETVHHLQMHSEVFLGEVVQHPCINKTLHEVAAILWEAQAGQPLIPNPLVVHVPIGQCL